MILTTCAACAAPLPPVSAKQCSRCKTRYCGPACQAQHWKEGGHDKLCKEIKRGGGAEQYHANKKYEEAVAVAAETCAEDTKGQTCYICIEVLHWKTKEGLVRGCSCRGTAGFAHVSCLAEQAKILVAEGEEYNLDHKAKNARWGRWHTCGLCEQEYHGVVACAFGWACWKTYLGRPEETQVRRMAMSLLGSGLSDAGLNLDALSVGEAELSTLLRVGASEDAILGVQNNLANTYEKLGRLESLRMRRDVYLGYVKLLGEDDERTLISANNYAASLIEAERFEEAKSLLLKAIPATQRSLGESDDLTLKMRWYYAEALCRDDGTTLDDIREAETTLEDTARIARRVLGGAHPLTAGVEFCLRASQAVLDARETPPPGSLQESP
jgi:hypothetical protein